MTTPANELSDPSQNGCCDFSINRVAIRCSRRAVHLHCPSVLHYHGASLITTPFWGGGGGGGLWRGLLPLVRFAGTGKVERQQWGQGRRHSLQKQENKADYVCLYSSPRWLVCGSCRSLGPLNCYANELVLSSFCSCGLSKLSKRKEKYYYSNVHCYSKMTYQTQRTITNYFSVCRDAE